MTATRTAHCRGGGDINFAVQLQLQDDDKLKVGKGGWFNTPWDTFKSAAGSGCTRFIWTAPFVLNADSISPNDLPHRAFIYAVHEKLLRHLAARGVDLKNRIEVIYPDKHIYNRSNSFFIHKSHIESSDWDDVVTLIHEAMHQWTVNWMRGAESPGCVADAHHKSPDKWKSARCSGFMEGFAQATALALYDDIFSSQEFFGASGKPVARPITLEKLRTSFYDGAIRKGDDAERTDKGWRRISSSLLCGKMYGTFFTPVTTTLHTKRATQPRCRSIRCSKRSRRKTHGMMEAARVLPG